MLFLIIRVESFGLLKEVSETETLRQTSLMPPVRHGDVNCHCLLSVPVLVVSLSSFSAFPCVATAFFQCLSLCCHCLLSVPFLVLPLPPFSAFPCAFTAFFQCLSLCFHCPFSALQPLAVYQQWPWSAKVSDGYPQAIIGTNMQNYAVSAAVLLPTGFARICGRCGPLRWLAFLL